MRSSLGMSSLMPYSCAETRLPCSSEKPSSTTSREGSSISTIVPLLQNSLPSG